MNEGSVWPFDFLSGDYPRPSLEAAGRGGVDVEMRFRCFILCPFTPSERAEALRATVTHAAQLVRDNLLTLLVGDTENAKKGTDIAVTVDMFPWAGTIHSDIWKSIRDYDIIVADVTGENPNVLYELGVAAAIKPSSQVILVAQRGHSYRFDLQPVRHLTYGESPGSDVEFQQKLVAALHAAAMALSFVRRPQVQRLDLPLEWTLRGADAVHLYGPSLVHRRATDTGLQFGGFSFAHTWLCVGNLALKNALVRMRFRFIKSLSTFPGKPGFVAISLRASGYLANYSRLFYVDQAGLAVRTVPHRPSRAGYYDHKVHDELSSPCIVPGSEWCELTHGLDEAGQLIGINGKLKYYPEGPAEEGFMSLGPGRILIQTWLAVIEIESLRVEGAQDLPMLATLPQGVTTATQGEGP